MAGVQEHSGQSLLVDCRLPEPRQGQRDANLQAPTLRKVLPSSTSCNCAVRSSVSRVAGEIPDLMPTGMAGVDAGFVDEQPGYPGLLVKLCVRGAWPKKRAARHCRSGHTWSVAPDPGGWLPDVLVITAGLGTGDAGVLELMPGCPRFPLGPPPFAIEVSIRAAQGCAASSPKRHCLFSRTWISGFTGIRYMTGRRRG